MSIVIDHVSKSFGPVRALQDVSVTFEEGKIYGLLGRNGAGKSTLLSVLTDRIFPEGGSVTVDGEPIHDNDRALSKMYLMSEKNCYPDSMKVKDAFRWTKMFYPDFDQDFAWNMASAFELNTNAKVSKLSTGYTSIFKLIVALSVNTPYVLLDEPVLGLDANHRDLFYRTLLARYTERPFTMVISTHLIEEVSSIIEDVVVIHKGEVLKKGPCQDLLSQGYTVSGPKSLVEGYLKGKNVLGVDVLGGLESAYLWGQPDRSSLPQGLEVSGLDLQKLFILMTGK
jgi:ABC-2 type transport system ATP-binding protein